MGKMRLPFIVVVGGWVGVCVCACVHACVCVSSQQSDISAFDFCMSFLFSVMTARSQQSGTSSL